MKDWAMYQPPPGSEVVFATPRRKECLDSQLVLNARGIRVQIVPSSAQWLLVVDQHDVPAATEELAAYREENQVQPQLRDPIEIASGAKLGVFCFAAVNLLIASLETQAAYGLPWLSAAAWKPAALRAVNGGGR
jgi:hypothetical protein